MKRSWGSAQAGPSTIPTTQASSALYGSEQSGTDPYEGHSDYSTKRHRSDDYGQHPGYYVAPGGGGLIGQGGPRPNYAGTQDSYTFPSTSSRMGVMQSPVQGTASSSRWPSQYAPGPSSAPAGSSEYAMRSTYSGRQDAPETMQYGATMTGQGKP